MDESTWLISVDLNAMLHSLEDAGTTSGRKLRLFAVACVRRIWRFVPTDACRRAVEVAERFADGLANPQELSAVSTEAYFSATEDAGYAPSNPVLAEYALSAIGQLTGHADPWQIVWGVTNYTIEAVDWSCGTENSEQGPQCALIRDIFGNPFRPVALNPS